jgi:hypothetical protein
MGAYSSPQSACFVSFQSLIAKPIKSRPPRFCSTSASGAKVAEACLAAKSDAVDAARRHDDVRSAAASLGARRVPEVHVVLRCARVACASEPVAEPILRLCAAAQAVDVSDLREATSQRRDVLCVGAPGVP